MNPTSESETAFVCGEEHPVIDGNGFSVTFGRKDLDLGLARILEYATGEQLIFQAKFLPTDIDRTFTDFNFAVYWLENQIHREANDPSKFGYFAKTIESTWTWDMWPEDYHVPETHAIAGIGLAWIEAARSKVGGGWRLTIGGYPDLCLGFAKWDDEAGVRALVDLLNDVDFSAIIALTYPHVAQSLVQRVPYTRVDITEEIIIEITKQNQLVENSSLRLERIGKRNSLK